jgi:hypothetical protein
MQAATAVARLLGVRNAWVMVVLLSRAGVVPQHLLLVVLLLMTPLCSSVATATAAAAIVPRQKLRQLT